MLRQDQFLYEDQEVLSVALMGHPELWDAHGREGGAPRPKAHEHFDVDRFSELEETVQRLTATPPRRARPPSWRGWASPPRVHRQPLSTLSGGFKLRVLLAQVLAGAPDVLLLDEPTNHLDILSIRWLEKFLHDFAGPVAVISHDHRFLDNVATHILDVDYQTVTLYHGNYTDFLEQKVEDRERREKEIEGRQKEIAHHQKFVDKFKAKASKARQAQSKLQDDRAEGGGAGGAPGQLAALPQVPLRAAPPERQGGAQDHGDHASRSATRRCCPGWTCR